MKRLNTPIIKEALKRLRSNPHLEDLKGVRIATKNSRSKRRLGCYCSKTRTIEINPSLHETNQDYIDTLLHELAHHVIAHYRYKNPLSHYGAHGKEWKQLARYLGATDLARSHIGKTTVPNYLKEIYNDTING